MACVTTRSVFVGLNLNVHNMAKTYKGTLSLDWYNKQQSILLREKEDISLSTDVPAPKINWVNKDEALFYEIDSEGGIGQTPYWVERNDIRVKEARPLIVQKVFKAVAESKPGTLQGMYTAWKVVESKEDDPAVENILIKGDNLLALNTLKKMFSNKPNEEKVKCIFIDPPYNTGRAFTQYDDNLELSEWLTLMRDRLIILYQLLADEGFIWITLDDKGVFHLKLILDEIFGSQNFVGNVIWQHSIQGKGYEGKFSVHHNYILCYKKNEEVKLGIGERLEKHNNAYSNPDNDPKGDWRTGDVRNSLYRRNLIYDIITPSGKIITPPANGWRWSEETLQQKIETGEVFFSEDETRIIRKIYLNDQEGRVPETIWFSEDIDDIPETVWYGKEVGTTREANKEIKNLFGKNVFDTPKPERLIKTILDLSTEEGDFVLDSFGGSGTTFAVAQKMGRRWVGVEIGKQADEVIVPRLKKVVGGEDGLGVSEELGWTGGGSFKYYHLGQSIITIDEDGTGDFNWSLGKKFIEESFLSSYDYNLDKTINLSEGQLFRDEENAPSIGVQTFGTKKRVAVVTLNQPRGKNGTLTYDEIFHIYSTIKKNLNPEYINIFTNKGLELAYDSKPEDLDVIKVPHAIFSELEK